MKGRKEIVYANDLRSAFLTAIVRAFETTHPDGALGRTVIQKLTYFVKLLGVPVPCTFGIFTSGPYSDDIAFSMESLLADEVIEDRNPGGPDSNYRPGRNAAALLVRFEDQIRPHGQRIHETVRVLGSFTPKEVDLMASLRFIFHWQVQVNGTSSKESVIREYLSIKREEFTDEGIRACYDALAEAGLIPKEPGASQAASV